MCGRYNIDADNMFVKSIAEALSEYERELLRWGDIYPTGYAPVITESRPRLLKWGFPRFDGKGVIINARAETVGEKITFKRGFSARRCVMPANGFYEWNGNKRKHYFYRTDGDPILLCGFYAPSDGIDGFVILTKPSTPPVSEVHNRIPVMIDRDGMEAYLCDGKFAESFITRDTDIKLAVRA